MLLNFKHLIISISCAPGKTREKNVPGMVNQHATQCANVSGFLINCRSSQCGQVGVASLAFNRFPPRAHNKTTANFPNFGQGQTADFWLGFFCGDASRDLREFVRKVVKRKHRNLDWA